VEKGSQQTGKAWRLQIVILLQSWPRIDRSLFICHHMLMVDRYEVTVGPEGRVLIPVEVRRATGIEPGTSVVVRVEGEQVVLIPHEAIKRRLRRMFADIEGSMAEELIAERRAEARRDTTGS
jgi:AbrB family looped-hinge helix DNA binding protein